MKTYKCLICVFETTAPESYKWHMDNHKEPDWTPKSKPNQHTEARLEELIKLKKLVISAAEAGVDSPLLLSIVSDLQALLKSEKEAAVREELHSLSHEPKMHGDWQQ